MEEPALLDGTLDDESVVQIIATFEESRTRLEGVSATIKNLRDLFSGYSSWLRQVDSVRRSDSPSEALRELAEQERREKVRRRARQYHEDDGIIDASEWGKLVRFAESLAMSESDALQICREVAGGRWMPPVEGWREPGAWPPHPTLRREGQRPSWGVADLHRAILDDFPAAMRAMRADPTSERSILGYLSRLTDEDGRATHSGAIAAKKAAQEADGHDTLPVWEFLWRTGLQELHLSKDLLPTDNLEWQVTSLEGLFELVETVPGAMERVGTLLSAGLLERWLAVVPLAHHPSALANDRRRELQQAGVKERRARSAAAALDVLWLAGMKSLPIDSDDGRTVYAPRDLAELAGIGQQGAITRTLREALELGLVQRWTGRVGADVDSTEYARFGEFAAEVWMWRHGSRRLLFGPDQPVVEDLAALRRLVDSGELPIRDGWFKSGALEQWCRIVLDRRDLGDAAARVADDGKARKAKRWLKTIDELGIEAAPTASYPTSSAPRVPPPNLGASSPLPSFDDPPVPCPSTVRAGGVVFGGSAPAPSYRIPQPLVSPARGSRSIGAPPAFPPGTRTQDVQKRSATTMALLTGVTCGLYQLAWTFSTSQELSRMSGKKLNPALDLLLNLATCGLWNLYALFRNARLVHELQTGMGLRRSGVAVPVMVLNVAGLAATCLGIPILPVTAAIVTGLLQAEYNAVADARARVAPPLLRA